MSECKFLSEQGTGMCSIAGCGCTYLHPNLARCIEEENIDAWEELSSLRAKLEKVEQSEKFTIEKVRHAAREQIDSKLDAANITIAQMRETLESVRRAYLNGMQHHDDCSCENCKVVLNAADIISTPLTQYEARVQRLLNAMKDIEYQLSFETYERMIKAKHIANEALLAFRGGKKV